MKKVIYITGEPGTGKSTIVAKLKQKGHKIFNELVDKFPIQKFPNPRSIETAEYIYKQNIKRDNLVNKSEGIIIVDRHPLENILIAKGLLQNKKDFEKIEKLYKKYNFQEGIIIKLISPKEIHKKRYLSKKVELISEDMIEEILSAYKKYSNYLTPNLEIDSTKNIDEIYSLIIKYINILK